MDTDVLVFDTTMGHGEQQPVLCFRDEEKVALAHQLVKLGVFGIDLMPSIDEQESRLVERLNATSLRERIGVATMVGRRVHRRRSDRVKLAHEGRRSPATEMVRLRQPPVRQEKPSTLMNSEVQVAEKVQGSSNAPDSV